MINGRRKSIFWPVNVLSVVNLWSLVILKVFINIVDNNSKTNEGTEKTLIDSESAWKEL